MLGSPTKNYASLVKYTSLEVRKSLMHGGPGVDSDALRCVPAEGGAFNF